MTPSQARAARRERRQRRGRIKRTAVFVGVGLVGAVFIFALFAPNLTPFLGAGSGGVSGFEERVDGVSGGRGNMHISTDETPHDPYTSVPATSGWHFGSPSAWGVHDEPLPDPVLVHNLEHAGVGVHYDCPEGCDELVIQLKDLVLSLQQQVSNKIIMAPYPDMGSTIALTAWTYIDKFEQFDETRIRDFVVAHVNSSVAPEPMAP